MADEIRSDEEQTEAPEPNEIVRDNVLINGDPDPESTAVVAAGEADLSRPETPPDEPSALYTGLLKRKIYLGIWGPYEIAAVGFAALFLFAAILFYLFFVIPADRELAVGRQQRDALEKELQSARYKWGGIQDTETQVAKLLTSANDFEMRALQDESIGRTSIYQRLNVLINAYNLRNTSGPDYVPLDLGEKGANNRESDAGKRGRDKLKSLFPGIFITTTIEGPYSAIRGFVRDIENSKEFMAITSIELEPSDEQETKAGTQTVEVSDEAGRTTTQRLRKGRYRGKTVSLRIEMAAYFRRPAELRPGTTLDDR